MNEKKLYTYNGRWTEEAIKKRLKAFDEKKCAKCGKPFKAPHRFYCSSSCAEDFFFHNHGGIWSEFRQQVLKRDNHKCVLCGKEGNEVDHIVELDRGGTNRLDNLRTLCHECHAKKTASYIRKKKFKETYMIILNPDDYLGTPKQDLITSFCVQEEVIAK